MGALTTGIIKEIPYLPALIPDGVLVSSLAVNTPKSLTTLTNLHEIPRIARFRRLRTSNTAKVSLNVTADMYSTPSVNLQAVMQVPLPTGLASDAWNVSAAAHLQASVTNGGTAAAANWWASWLMEVDRPNAALVRQYPATYPTLTPEQALAAQTEHLHDPLIGDLAPRPLEWIMQNEYWSHLRQAVMLGKTVDLPASLTPTTFIDASRANADEMLVLAGLNTSAGTTTSGLTLIIGIDERDSLYTVPAYALSQVDYIPLFLQARKSIKIQAYSSEAGSASIAANIWHVALTDTIRQRLGLGAPTDIQQAVEAGTL